MKRVLAALWLGLVSGGAAGWLLGACGSDTPTLPGQFLGSFFFTGNLVSSAGGGLSTTCLIDGGALFFPISPQFYAEVSLLADAGQVVWQPVGPPAQDGGVFRAIGMVQGSAFTVVTSTQALVSGCDCTASLVETISLSAGDAGLVPGLPTLGGTIDDRLDPNAGDAGPVCVADAGPGCQLGCDLIYQVTGVPGRP